MTNRVHLLTWK